MKFLVVTFAPLLLKEGIYYSYAPYVKEMELWLNHADEVAFCCPDDYSGKNVLLSGFASRKFTLFTVPELRLKDIYNPYKLLKVLAAIYKAMCWADHIHLRCPGNMGLLGTIVQLFFPHKPKTAKYAGNWDWKSRQPWSYRIQQRILRNTFLTRNITVLVYGEWPDRTRNILPFFTASYSEQNKIVVKKPDINACIRLAYIGSLTSNKNPLTSLKVLKELKENGIPTHLTFCGDGPENSILLSKATAWGVSSSMEVLGNVDDHKVQKVLQQAHFLVFISDSEGWPKVVTEAMWWGCIPITSKVSCVPQMLGYGTRGILANNDSKEIAEIIKKIKGRPDQMKRTSIEAMEWARQFTLERFENEISNLLNAPCTRYKKEFSKALIP